MRNVQMHSNPNLCLILLVNTLFLAPAQGQTSQALATPGMTVLPRRVISPTPVPAVGSNSVEFHDPKRPESAPEPPAALQKVAAKLSATFVPQSPNPLIEFILTFENNGPQEVKVLDPLDSLSLSFRTTSKGPVTVPDRLPNAIIDVKPPKGAMPGAKRDRPYPAPIQFNRIVHGTLVSYQKEASITIPAHGSVQIVFTSEPVVTERVINALRSETGEAARSFKAKAFLALISDPPQAGGRTLYSDSITLTLPYP
jgi:hypothetical protein